MIPRLKMPAWITATLRIILAAIFIYAGISKMINPLRFVTDIGNFHLLPWVATVPLALYLPWLEIVCGLALFSSRSYRGGLLILLALTFVFVLALVSARVRGIDISCGCFGHAMRDLSFASHLTIDFGIIVALLYILKTTAARVEPL